MARSVTLRIHYWNHTDHVSHDQWAERMILVVR